MKKMIGLGIATTLVAIMAIAAGCSTWGNGKLDNPLTSTPYQSGRTFVVVDLLTEDIQPKEMATVIDQVYALAKVDFTAEILSDELVKNQIDEMYPDSSVEFRQLIFNAYGILKIRLASEVEARVDIPDIEVVSEFFRGVNDALELYRPQE